MLSNDGFVNDQNEGMVFEERRSFRRVPVNIDMRFFYSNMYYSGKISNISETGIFINTRQRFLIGTILVLMIRNESEYIRVFVKIKRMKRSHGNFDGIGVKLVSPSKGYSGFVKDLKTTD